MADYGVDTSTYAPDVITGTGLIGKIAEQIVKGETVKSEFDALYKKGFTTGKDLEIAVYEKATGQAYSATSTSVTASFPTEHVLLFTSSEKRTYGVRIDEKDVAESAKDAGKAAEIARQIVETLYSGAYSEANGYIKGMFTGADASDDEIVDGGVYDEPTNETNAKALLYQIKNIAALIRKGSAAVNPSGLQVKAERVGLLIPINNANGVDVYARLSSVNAGEFAQYGVDDVFLYDASADATAEIYVFDEEYAQIHRVHPDSYREKQMEENDNYKAFLHTYTMFAACPLFSCVRLSEVSAANPLKSGQKFLMNADPGTGTGSLLPTSTVNPISVKNRAGTAYVVLYRDSTTGDLIAKTSLSGQPVTIYDADAPAGSKWATTDGNPEIFTINADFSATNDAAYNTIVWLRANSKRVG